jgi:hypothetical protein
MSPKRQCLHYDKEDNPLSYYKFLVHKIFDDNRTVWLFQTRYQAR